MVPPQKKHILFVAILHILSLFAPLFANTDLNPDQAQEMILASQADNGELREEGLSETRETLEKDLQSPLHYLAYQAARIFGDAYMKDRASMANLTRIVAGRAPQELIEEATRIFSTFEDSEKSNLQQALLESGIEGSFDFYMEHYLIRETFWEEFSEDGDVSQRCTVFQEGITEENYTAVGLIAALKHLGMGTSKEQLLAFVALVESREEEGIFQNPDSPEAQRFFRGKYTHLRDQSFEDEEFSFYFALAINRAHEVLAEEDPSKAGKKAKKAFIKYVTVFGEEMVLHGESASHQLRHTGQEIARMGVRGAQSTRSGVQGLLKFQQATFKGLVAAGKQGFKALGQSASIPKVTAHGLGHFATHTVQGTIAGVLAEALVESAIVLAVGQKHDQIEVGEEEIEIDTQRTSSQATNGLLSEYIKDRKFAFLDLAEDAADNWEAKAAGTVAGAVAIAALGTALPAVLVAAAVGYVAYEGVKAVTKMEWYQNWKNSALIDQLTELMQSMPHVQSMNLSEDALEEKAEARARDMMKRKEVAKQSPQRMYFVDRLDSVQFYQNGRYWYFKNENPQFGERFDDEAHSRYDIIDVDGQQGVYDVKLENRLMMVGHLEKTSGLDVQFVTPDNTFAFEDSRRLLKNREDSNFRVLSNGSVWTKDENDPEKWMVKALVHNTDLVLRENGGRFTWNPDRDGYEKSDLSFVIEPRDLNSEASTPASTPASSTISVAASDPLSDTPGNTGSSSEDRTLDDAFGIAP